MKIRGVISNIPHEHLELVQAEAKFWRLKGLLNLLGGSESEEDIQVDKEDYLEPHGSPQQVSLLNPPPVQKYSQLRFMEIYRLMRLDNQQKAVLRWADLSGLVLSCSFSGLDLTGANLSHSDLSAAVLTNSVLAYCNLIGTDLSGKDFANSNLSFVRLPSQLIGTKFNQTTLVGVDLTKPKMKDVVFTGIYFFIQSTDS